MSSPRVLFVDLETFPNIGYTWEKWETNVIRFIKEWELASFAWKWLGEDSVKCLSRRSWSEIELVKRLRDLFDQAQVIVAHNGDDFDLKKARTKFVQFGMKPPGLFRSIDTKKIAKSQFSFNSNSLNDLGEFLGVGKKVDTGGFDLWLDCMHGKASGWALMEKYNKQDVVLLEKVYTRLKIWAPNHPNLALLAERPGCPVCASPRIQSRGYRIAAKTKQRRYQCQSCSHWFTGKENLCGKPSKQK